MSMRGAALVAKTQEAWQLAHVRLVELARERAGLDLEEGRWLLEAHRQSVHRELGYGSFAEYVERLFGYAPRVTHDKLRVAEALERLPELSRELWEGNVTYSHVRELTRVVTPETEKSWLKSAQGRTVREVEKLVSGHRPGSLPDSPTEPEQQRHVLRFEVSGETLASFREAVAQLRREAGGHLDDDAVILLLARRALGGPTDEGRASYQVAVDVCERCQRTRQVAAGETVELSQAAAAMVHCDAQHVSSHVGAKRDAAPVRATQDMPPATRRAGIRRDRGRCQVPGCAHTHFVDLHHVVPRSEGGGHEPSNLVTLCGAHHRAAHEGTLVVSGNAEAGFGFRHADGTAYGARPTAPVAFAQARAFQALRGLGFGEREARKALDDALRDEGAAAELEPLLRSCLALLTK
jgi:RuvA, C-terminal domain/HNH endonuclease